jgi:hypothetical protein
VDEASGVWTGNYQLGERSGAWNGRRERDERERGTTRGKSGGLLDVDA